MNRTVPQTKYLELLAQSYPTIQAASAELINLQALLHLPKGTEHFMSDLHAEHEAFIHILNNASGEIREIVDKLFAKMLTKSERAQLSTLIYYPEKKLKMIKEEMQGNLDEWYLITLHCLIEICLLISTDYSRNKVRRVIPGDYGFIINELINAENTKREPYFESIISSIIETGSADDMIIALATVIKRLIVDRLHIVGDIFDRGERPDIIIDLLMKHHSVDIQWGNHDALWMGAAAGSELCIANVIFIAIKYGNIESLETAYGINLRPLAIFAQERYQNSEKFNIKIVGDTTRSEDEDLLIKMYQAICLLLFKLVGQVIHRHPEYDMDDRLLLEKIDYRVGKIDIRGRVYDVDLNDLKMINPEDPYSLNEKEARVVRQLVTSFRTSEKLQTHIRFLYSVGSMYLISNNNLMFHGCMPLNEDGSFQEFILDGKKVKGKALFDLSERLARQGYYAPEGSKERETGLDYLWFLWCGRNSPLFGREQMTAFERLFIDDQSAWVERDNPYYELIENPEICKAIFQEFDLDYENGYIINGHVPVSASKGESPIKGNGKVIVIDGGFCRAYQEKTGIAGYTLINDSYGMRITSHAPFPGMENAIKKNLDILSQDMVFKVPRRRLTVGDTDAGKHIQEQIEELKQLLQAYRKGQIKERALKQK